MGGNRGPAERGTLRRKRRSSAKGTTDFDQIGVVKVTTTFELEKGRIRVVEADG